MKQKKLTNIEAKIRLGMPLTKKEKYYYFLYSNALDLEIGAKITL